jgi:hypothetical protein
MCVWGLTFKRVAIELPFFVTLIDCPFFCRHSYIHARLSARAGSDGNDEVGQALFVF